MRKDEFRFRMVCPKGLWTDRRGCLGSRWLSGFGTMEAGVTFENHQNKDGN